jgi:hypothetical protein
MATTGFSFRGSDRVLILGGVLVLLWAWNPDALRKIFPFLPPFPGTGDGGASKDEAPAPAGDPSPFVPSPWWSLPTPDPDPAPSSPSPAPASPAPSSPAPAVPAPALCYEPGSICAALRFGVKEVSPGPWGCPMVRCRNGTLYNSASVYPTGVARTIGQVHEEGDILWWPF